MCGGGNSNILTGLADAAVQLSSGGLVGYDADNGVVAGEIGGRLLQGTKELTGAQAAEDANTLAREQIEEQKATALQLREEAKAQTAAEQLATSRQAAGAARGTASSTGSRAGSTQLEERDFLGI